MKVFYLAVSLFFIVILLIIAFENINSTLQKWFFLFFRLGQYDAFFLVVVISFVGFVIGVFFTLFVRNLLKNTDDEDPGSEIF